MKRQHGPDRDRPTTGRGDWVRAAWAESGQAPAGPRRLAWRAGAVWVAARQLLTPRGLARVLLFSAAALVVGVLSWPGSSANFTTLVDRVDAVAVAVLLAAVAFLARRRYGPVRDGWLARILRIGAFAAILAVMPAKAAVEQFTYTVPPGGERLRLYNSVGGLGSAGFNWFGEILFLLIMTGYAVTIMWMTSKRAGTTGATLAAGAIGGLVIGGVMYLIAPLGGVGKHPTSPWFSGSVTALLIGAALVALLAGPAIVGLLGARLYPDPGASASGVAVRQRQGLVAGTLATLVGALVVTVAGTGTIALMVKSATVRNWLTHGQHLTANALYLRELNAGTDATVYFLMCVTFPVLGLLCAVIGAGLVFGRGDASQPDAGEREQVRI